MMKLSDAILLGSLKAPQAFQYFRFNLSHSNYGTCALGAALDAVNALPGVLNTSTGTARIQRIWPNYPSMLMHDVMFWNDTSKWTRQRIAEQVAKLENKHPEWYQEVEVKEEVMPPRLLLGTERIKDANTQNGGSNIEEEQLCYA